MITKYGMSKKLGPISFGESSNEVFIGRDMGHVKNYSEKTASEIDDEIYAIVQEGYEKVTQILTTNIDKLHEVAGVLLEKEKLTGEEFTAIMKGEYVPEKYEKNEESVESETEEKSGEEKTDYDLDDYAEKKSEEKKEKKKSGGFFKKRNDSKND